MSIPRDTSRNKSCIKGILFDLDGTILDTYQSILQSMQYAAHTVLKRDIPPDELMKKVGQPLVVQIADFCDSEEQFTAFLAAYRARNAETNEALTKPFPGCPETLDSLLRAGFILGVVTSKMHKAALEGLELFELDRKMSCLVGADDCEHHKPEPEPVLQGAKLLGLKAHQCVYVEDSPYDMRAGNTAGATTIAALWGMFPPKELIAENPDYQCSSLTACAATIMQLP